MSSPEFAEWMAYESIEPGEPHRGDAQTAQICFVIVSILRQLVGEKGSGPEFKDFLLKFELDDLVRRSPEEVEQKLRGWFQGALARQEKEEAKSGKHRKHSSDPKS